MGNKWVEKLRRLEGAVDTNVDIFSNVLETDSPSFNFVFGKCWGLPLGYTVAMFGPPGGGKSLATYMMAGKLHKNDPEALVVKFNTEFREEAQFPVSKLFGVDPDRYVAYQVNQPAGIFDRTEKEIAAQCESGAPIKLVIIDSVNSIRGRRDLKSTSINVAQRGDHAATLQDGFKRILEVQRKYKFSVIVICQVRAEQDEIELKRGKKIKMAVSFGVQHYAEYFLFIEKNRTLKGRQDILENNLVNEAVADLKGKEEQTGHKIRFTMEKSSFGVAGRSGEFTLDYSKGIVNVHEEVFLLGVNRGVIERPNDRVYIFEGKKWNSKADMVHALQESTDLQTAVIKELRRRDMAGEFHQMDEAAEKIRIESDGDDSEAYDDEVE